MSKQWVISQRVQKVWNLLIQDSEQLLKIKGMVIDNRARHIARQFATHLSKELESVLYYPHPFSNGGFVVVLKDEVKSVVDPITRAFRYVPPDMSLHCLRSAELLELSLPSFTWLHVLNRRLHLPFCLKYRATLLYGRDIRDQLPEPPDPRVLLNLHIEACAHFLRNHAILGLLMRKQYLELTRRLNWQIKCLMATALLAYNEWDVTMDQVPDRFATRYPDKKLNQAYQELIGTMHFRDPLDEDACRQSAYQAVWLFECFLRRLRGHAK